MAQSRNEAALENILGATNTLEEPTSRNEKILHNILGASYELDEPMSRIEVLLKQILDGGYVPAESIYSELIAATYGGE